jgi:hypothetical protein
MLKQIFRSILILMALVVTGCGPAGLEVQAEGQVTVGGTEAAGTPTAVVAPTNTAQPPSPTAVPPTSEIQIQVEAQVEGAVELATANGLEGTWQITDFSTGMISLLGDANAQAYLGKQAVFASNSIAFDGQTCADVTFARHSASLSAFLGTDFATVMTDLGITQEQVDLITTTCGVFGFNSFVQVDPNTLIVNLNGTFFVFRK